MTNGVSRGSSFTHDTAGEVYEIAMTWPMYRNNECRYNGRRVKLRPQAAELLSILLMRRGSVVSWVDLIEAMWPNPDEEVEYPRDHIQVVLCFLRRTIPNVVVSRWGSGLMIELPQPANEAEQRLIEALAA
jgi:DNA-binding response OmpR family regulator